MFDTIRIGGTQYVHSSVTEKRAPTDESVRILSEMEAAAEKRVIERGNSKCASSGLEVRWTCIHDNFDPDALKLHLFFSINGREHHLNLSTCPSKFMDPKEKFRLIHEQVVKCVAETISCELLRSNSMMKTISGR